MLKSHHARPSIMADALQRAGSRGWKMAFVQLQVELAQSETRCRELSVRNQELESEVARLRFQVEAARRSSAPNPKKTPRPKMPSTAKSAR